MQENSQKKSIVKQNILQMIDLLGITRYDFYKKTHITRGVLDQNNGMSEENIAKFLAYFPKTDANWLLTGEGSMYRHTTVQGGTNPPNRDKYIQMLESKIEDQQKIIDLLEDKIQSLTGSNANTNIEAVTG